MNCLAKKAVVGSVFALGLAVGPVLAQQGEHGGDHGAHQHDNKPSSPASALPKCPISGEPINFSVSVETDGGPVFLCCTNCVAKYEANPTKYTEKVAAQRKTLADRDKVQVTCPVSGESIDPKAFVEHDGKKVFLCCDRCAKKYRKNPGEYNAALANSYTYQTKCPIMGEEIDPTVSTTLSTGETIYYCCPKCDKQLRENPAKYNKNLVAQGVLVNWAEAKKADSGTGHEGHDHGAHGHEGHDH